VRKVMGIRGVLDGLDGRLWLVLGSWRLGSILRLKSKWGGCWGEAGGC